ncbi:hypothetical protein P9B03_11995 [Metasolibacillus meyeri]|uniref:Uncharacterized protein n=1 Tax=Metasolibacillus meyeri TaxID=1071052 RepID=A0AAW9NW70_9BACL|nr:hypothetical protein [Metasolibacillus meyeri]MEC1179208.1 hypothetical protein [Metasolibacillus meyeri]
MIIKNYEIAELQSFLFNLSLKSKESRMRTRFINLLDEQQELIKKERLMIIDEYASKNEAGLAVTEKKLIDNEEVELVVFPNAEVEIDVKNQIALLMNEDFIIEETESKIDMLKCVQEIVLNCDLELSGAKASLYNRFCEMFEDIHLLEV